MWNFHYICLDSVICVCVCVFFLFIEFKSYLAEKSAVCVSIDTLGSLNLLALQALILAKNERAQRRAMMLKICKGKKLLTTCWKLSLHQQFKLRRTKFMGILCVVDCIEICYYYWKAINENAKDGACVFLLCFRFFFHSFIHSIVRSFVRSFFLSPPINAMRLWVFVADKVIGV